MIPNDEYTRSLCKILLDNGLPDTDENIGKLNHIYEWRWSKNLEECFKEAFGFTPNRKWKLITKLEIYVKDRLQKLFERKKTILLIIWANSKNAVTSYAITH